MTIDFTQLLLRETPDAVIGLALTGNLVAIQGGEIAVESEIGRGSRFIVVLPLVFEGGQA